MWLGGRLALPATRVARQASPSRRPVWLGVSRALPPREPAPERSKLVARLGLYVSLAVLGVLLGREFFEREAAGL